MGKLDISSIVPFRQKEANGNEVHYNQETKTMSSKQCTDKEIFGLLFDSPKLSGQASHGNSHCSINYL